MRLNVCHAFSLGYEVLVQVNHYVRLDYYIAHLFLYLEGIYIQKEVLQHEVQASTVNGKNYIVTKFT